ncbi:MAG: DMT family transporter [Pirellulaceae bacterium]
MSPPPKHLPPQPHKLVDPLVLGTICGLASAVIYTAANAFLRSVSDCDLVWVSAVKALPTVLFMFPWVVILYRKGHRVGASWPILLLIAGAGLIGQMVGNISFQYALGEVGVALAVPLTLGGMIVSATILGRIFLHEPVSPRAALSLGILLVAIAILSLGADDARAAVTRQPGTRLELAAGVAAGCLSGLAYSILNVVIRYTALKGMPLPSTLLIVSLVGILSLGTLSYLRLGTAGIAATGSRDLTMMLLAGVCNALAFLALSKSLQLMSVLYVNALNATQATLAAAAGVLIFGEALSPWLLAGIGLTIGGLLVLSRGRQSLIPPRPA